MTLLVSLSWRSMPFKPFIRAEVKDESLSALPRLKSLRLHETELTKACVPLLPPSLLVLEINGQVPAWFMYQRKAEGYSNLPPISTL
jgi:hypothetical protein